jgi:hypothetical protein
MRSGPLRKLTTAAVSLVLAGLISACVAAPQTDPQPDTAPAGPSSFSARTTPPAPAVRQAQVVTGLTVAIPAELKVSEANSYYPIADIVWRGDPPGDRRAQIRSMFEDGFAAARLDRGTGRRVVADITITRFHALTEKTRYSFGGVHSIKFDLTVRDAATGAVIDGPRPVNADVEASGGIRALAEEQAGRTQRVVIVEDLVRVLQRELGNGVPVASRAAVTPLALPPF